MASASNSELGRSYRARRAALPLPQGDLCPFFGIDPKCPGPMWPTQRLQTDHAIARVLGGCDSGLRWSHGSCNEAAGARLGNRLRARRQGRKWVDRWA